MKDGGRRNRADHRERAPHPEGRDDPFGRHNAFLGIPLSTAVVNGLLEVMRRGEGRGDGPGAAFRWVSPLYLHVNLRHLGTLFPEHLKYLSEELAAGLATTERFPVHIGAFELWPDPTRPLALRARLEGESGVLQALRDAVDGVLRATEFEVPDHPFEPHVTLAVFETPEGAQDLLQRVSTFRSAASGRFWVSDVHLFVQALEPFDEPFETWSRVPLRRRAGARGEEDGGDEGGRDPSGVRYQRPTLPTPRVIGGGRPVLPGPRPGTRRSSEALAADRPPTNHWEPEPPEAAEFASDDTESESPPSGDQAG